MEVSGFMGSNEYWKVNAIEVPCSATECNSLGLSHKGIKWYLQSKSINEIFSRVNTWLIPL